MSEYSWKSRHTQEPGISEAFELRRIPYGFLLGYLKKGGRKRQGWFVHDFRLADAITRLPHTLTEDEAKDAAKMILLSLKGRS